MTGSSVALVTGANKGIGKEIVRQLAKQGLKVFLGSRDELRGSAAVAELKKQGLNVELVMLDIDDPKSIETAVNKLTGELGHLDILINNAGVFLETEVPSKSDSKLLRKTFETNYFGAVNITQAMLPLLRNSEHKVIVNVSSALGSEALHSDPKTPSFGVSTFAYNSSKAALNSFTVLLAQELRSEGFHVNSIHPGFTATDMNEHQGTGTVEQGAQVAVKCALAGKNAPTGSFFTERGTLPW